MRSNAVAVRLTRYNRARVLAGLAALMLGSVYGALTASPPARAQLGIERNLPVEGPPPAATRGLSPEGIPLTDEGPAAPPPETIEDGERPARIAPPPLEPIASPQFWDPRLRRTRPDLSALSRLRFLTAPNFPPFTEVDALGRPRGYHVELVRELCRVLEVADRCQIQVLPWNQLRGALARGEGDAIVAGLAVSGESRRNLAFTEPYMRFPARFATNRDSGFEPATAGRVGVVRRTAHAAMLDALFPQHTAVPFASERSLADALADGSVDAAFGDGASQARWLATRRGRCCDFVGGPYFSDHFLGRGLAIAARAGEGELVDALDWALAELAAEGRLEELYLRAFPVGFY